MQGYEQAAHEDKSPQMVKRVHDCRAFARHLQFGERKSVRFVRCIINLYLVRNPIHFPRFAAILRERLLKVG